jgi:hypothetical protein
VVGTCKGVDLIFGEISFQTTLNERTQEMALSTLCSISKYDSPS